MAFKLKAATLFPHRTTLAALLFLLFAYLIYWFKPTLLFQEDGSFRDFGTGTQDKTVFPIWLAFMVLAIACYMLLTWILSPP